MTARTIGIAVAGLLTAALIGVLGYSIVASQSPAPPQGPTGPSNGSGAEPGQTTELGGIDAGNIGTTERGRVEGVDEATGAFRYIIEFDEITPIDAVRSRVVNPVARFFEDGAIVRIAAAEGEVLWPSQDQRPESGRLEGSVDIRVFEREPGAIEPTGDATVALTTDRLRFQTLLGQVETPGAFRLESAGVTLEGEELLLRASEAQGRLQYLRIARGLRVSVDPDELSGNGAADDPADANATTAAANKPDDAASPDIDIYRLTVADRVVVEQGPRGMTADRAEVLMRLIDGELAPDAIAPIATTSSTTTRDTDPQTPSDPSAADEPAESNAVVLTADGPLELIAIDGPDPVELADNDVTLRMSSPDTATVTLNDDAAGISADAGSVFYGMTSRELRVRGVGGELGVEVRAELDAGRRARFLGGAIDVDLNAGSALIPGAGEVRLSDADAEPAVVRWNDQADVFFDLGERDGSRPRLRRLLATGEVRGEAGASTLSGRDLRIDFAETLGPDGEPATRVDTATLVGDARVTTIARTRTDETVRERATIDANTLRVVFAESLSPSGEPVPSTAFASGGATAEFAGDRLTADDIRLDLAPPAGNDENPTIDRLTAQGDADVRTAEGYRLRASTVRYSETDGTLEASSDSPDQPASVAMLDYRRADGLARQAAVITAPAIRIDRDPARLTAFGPGRLDAAFRDRSPATPPGGALDQAVIEFSNTMLFDDARGFADFDGTVNATLDRPGRRERFTAEGDRLRVDFTPGIVTQNQDAQSPDAPPIEAIENLRLTTSDDEPAQLSARRFDGVGTAGRTVFFLDLTGRTILGSGERGTIDVPGPGELRIVDLRRSGGTEPSPDDARGAAVFSWLGDFRVDSRVDIARMSRGVRARHLHPEADAPTLLEAESLAVFAGPGQATPQPARPGDAPAGLVGLGDTATIQRIVADGAVWAQQDDTQLVCDNAVYERATGELTATASEGNRLTVFDAARAQHFSARRVILDLARGTWRAADVAGGGVE